MPTQILSVGTTTANSGDVTVAGGDTLTVCLKAGVGPNVVSGAKVDIQLKDDAGEYFTVETLTRRKLATVIVGPGTYRFRRYEGGACGVFSG